MLNELIALERGMSEHGFAPVARHPDLSQLGKGPVVQVRLAVDGSIAKLDLLDGPDRGEIWTLRDGKQNGFPGLKTKDKMAAGTPCGLLVLNDAERSAHDEIWRTALDAVSKHAEIERLATTFALDPEADEWPKAGHRTRIGERLEALRSLDASPAERSVPAACERFLRALETQPPFLHRLFESLIDRARSGNDAWLEIIREALIGSIALAIDVPAEEFERDAIDPRQIAAVTRALSDGNAPEPTEAKRCALTGGEARLLEGNFPQPTLPSLGQSYLFSRNTDIRAFARYGRNGPEAMPVSADLLSRFSGALSELTAQRRRGKTWRLLPSEAGDKQDLFLAFIAAAIDDDVADAFGAADDDEPAAASAREVGQVETATSRLVEFWRGVADRAKPGERARVLILRSVDPGNRKAVYDRSPSISRLYEAAVDWAAAMENHPVEFMFPVFHEKTLKHCRPGAQAPLSLISQSRKLYIRGGRQAVDAIGLSGAQALALFLNEGDRGRRALRILHLLLTRQEGLLSSISHADRRGQIKDFDPKLTARRDALSAVAWIGALLSFAGRNKEIYMEDAGYKLGQLLSAADAIHIGYCTAVRGGSMPPTLIGNSVFAAAGRNPDRALDVLQSRWKPYHAWATKAAYERAGEPKDAKGWAIIRAVSQARQARRLCEELRPVLVRMREEGRTPDEVFRAELLLGYMAGVRSEKPSDVAETNQEEAVQ
jgi:hypothetical protein